MPFDPVSGRHNFLSAKDRDYFKQQIEEMHASESMALPTTSKRRSRRSNGAT
jgi:hypothetical protein